MLEKSEIWFMQNLARVLQARQKDNTEAVRKNQVVIFVLNAYTRQDLNF